VFFHSIAAPLLVVFYQTQVGFGGFPGVCCKNTTPNWLKKVQKKVDLLSLFRYNKYMDSSKVDHLTGS
jgi:hypothetical protein